MQDLGIWILSLASIAGILFRPWKTSEWPWAVGGALLLTITTLISWQDAGHAALDGFDVYFFLLGMMFLSEIARGEGLFDWLASLSAHFAKKSSHRLMLLVYGAGILVTIFLSNDATAVVLTPAVYKAVKKSGAKPLPYLFACAFVANAASFILPISNPGNLVVYHSHLPTLLEWMKAYAIPCIAAIVVTYIVLCLWFWPDLQRPLESTVQVEIEKLSTSAKITLWGLILVVAALMISSAYGWDLGLPTFVTSLFVVAIVYLRKKEWPREVVKDTNWSVVPLVAGLFVIVKAMNQAGALRMAIDFFKYAALQSEKNAQMLAAFGVGFISNILNNLPTGLSSGLALQMGQISEPIKKAVLVGIDLGPNLSVTGSLATILWLMALRREGEKVSALKFFLLGCLAMPLAMAAAISLL